MRTALSVGTCDLGPRVLTGYRRRASFLLVLGALLVRWGVATLRTPGGGPMAGESLLLGLGSVAVVVGVVQLLRPPTLMLDQDGFVLRQPFGGARTERWSDCDAFVVVEKPVRLMVSFRTRPLRGAHPRSAWVRRVLAGVDGALPGGTGGLKADELALLLNRYREHYVGPRVGGGSGHVAGTQASARSELGAREPG